MVGAGYVGLVSGACFLEFGTHVVCVDKDAQKVARLEAEEMPIFEPGLADLVVRNETAGRLTFTTNLKAAVKGCDAVFITVGTPSHRGDGRADLTYVYDAAREIADAADPDTVVVTKSTVPVGTGREVEAILHQAAPDKRLHGASNPEFLREGSAIGDFIVSSGELPHERVFSLYGKPALSSHCAPNAALSGRANMNPLGFLTVDRISLRAATWPCEAIQLRCTRDGL